MPAASDSPSSDRVFGLAIETSNPSASDGSVLPSHGPGVAIARLARGPAGWVIDGAVHSEPLKGGPESKDDLLQAIDRACRHAGASPKALGLIAVSIGPGGYTALRVAATAGNMIAYATGASCVCVPSALVVARAVSFPGRFAVLLAGKGQSAFATTFEAGWAERLVSGVPSGGLITGPEVLDLKAGRLIADRFLPQPIREEAARAGLAIDAPQFDARNCLELGCLLPAGGPGSFVPLYAREPEAVTLWRARREGSGA